MAQVTDEHELGGRTREVQLRNLTITLTDDPRPRAGEGRTASVSEVRSGQPGTLAEIETRRDEDDRLSLSVVTADGAFSVVAGDLDSIYMRLLVLASDGGAERIVVPVLGLGLDGLADELAIDAMARAVDEHLLDATPLHVTIRVPTSHFEDTSACVVERLGSHPDLSLLVSHTLRVAPRAAPQLKASHARLRKATSRTDYAAVSADLFVSALNALAETAFELFEQAPADRSDSDTIQDGARGGRTHLEDILACPVDELLDCTEQMLLQTGHHSGGDLSAACAAALTALARTSGGADATDEIANVRHARSLLLAVEKVLVAAYHEHPSAHRRTPELMVVQPTDAVDTAHTPTRIFHERLGSSRRAVRDQVLGRPARSRVSDARQDAQGSAHVYRLRDLMLRASPRSRLEQHARFRGPDSLDMRVLRACAVSHDLDELLIEVLGSDGIARELGSEVLAATTAERARTLLERLGFPNFRKPRGWRDVADQVRRGRQHALQAADSATIQGHVTSVAQQIEYTLIVLLRFVVMVAFRRDADAWFRERAQLDRPLRRCSLGTLLELARYVSDQLRSATTPLGALAREISLSELLPDAAQDLAHRRNRLVHFDKEPVPAFGDVRAAGERFFEAVQALLEHVGPHGTRLFPRVIRICRLEIDELGRRYFTAVDDEDLPHKLFVDATLRIGGRYYMRRPKQDVDLHIHPILVHAGDQDDTPTGGPS